MPRLARLADKFTVVRSFSTKTQAQHPADRQSFVEGGEHRRALLARGWCDAAKLGVPTNVVLFPLPVDAHVPGPEARGNISATGPYSKGFAPFIPGKGGQLQDDMNLALSRDRFERRKLLAGLDSLNRSVDLTGQVGALDEIQQQAAEVLLGGGVPQRWTCRARTRVCWRVTTPAATRPVKSGTRSTRY